MKTRFLAGSVMFLLLALVVASRMFTLYIFDAAFVFIAVIATLEIAKASNTRNNFVDSAMAATFPIVLYIGVLIGIMNERNIGSVVIYFISIILAFFVFNFLSVFISKDTTTKEMQKLRYSDSLLSYALKRGFYAVKVFIYPALLFISLIILNHIEVFYKLVNPDAVITSFVYFIILAVFVSTIFTDIFAFLMGSKFKGPKLCPKISPNKTISGAVSGLLFSLIGILALFMIFSNNINFLVIFNTNGGNIFHIILLGVLGSVATQSGDLVASSIKRSAGIKDFANILPGHGGVMDRVDGLIFNSTFMLIFSLIFLF